MTCLFHGPSVHELCRETAADNLVNMFWLCQMVWYRDAKYLLCCNANYTFNCWRCFFTFFASVAEDNFTALESGLIIRLSTRAQFSTLINSDYRMSALQAGIYVSSAYFTISLPADKWGRPNCLILLWCWLITDTVWIWYHYTPCSGNGQWRNQSTNQLQILSDILSTDSFSRSTLCQTVSKALVKSRKNATTYGLVVSIWVTIWRIVTTATVVEPLGQKANWSARVKLRAGWRKNG